MNKHVLLLFGLFFVCGCGGSTDGWYEDSKAVDERKDEFINFQMNHANMSEKEAKAAWALNYSIEQTHKRPPAEVEGGELRDKLAE